jgi:hypothetical protein
MGAGKVAGTAVIEVERADTVPDGWAFLVRVTEGDSWTEHRVTLARADYERLTGLAVLPEALVRKTFEFLLAHEPKTAILRQFELTVVARYFPDFESQLQRTLTS